MNVCFNRQLYTMPCSVLMTVSDVIRGKANCKEPRSVTTGSVKNKLRAEYGDLICTIRILFCMYLLPLEWNKWSFQIRFTRLWLPRSCLYFLPEILIFYISPPRDTETNAYSCHGSSRSMSQLPSQLIDRTGHCCTWWWQLMWESHFTEEPGASGLPRLNLGTLRQGVPSGKTDRGGHMPWWISKRLRRKKHIVKSKTRNFLMHATPRTGGAARTCSCNSLLLAEQMI